MMSMQIWFTEIIHIANQTCRTETGAGQIVFLADTIQSSGAAVDFIDHDLISGTCRIIESQPKR
jgi:hypothetical protein